MGSLRVAILLASVAVVAGAVPAAHAAFPGRNGRLVIESDRYCGSKTNDPYCSRAAIYVAPRSGGRLRRVTRPADDYRTPAWSSDGRSIYVAGRDGLYALRADGSGRRPVGPTAGREFALAPDGRRIAWTFTPRGGGARLVLMHLDGSRSRSLAIGAVSIGSPAWSPDGKRIALVLDLEAYVVRADGRGLRRITGARRRPRLFVHGVSWAPDGHLLAVVRGDTWTHTGTLWVMRPDGSHQRLVAGGVDLKPPAWSPDGRRIAVIASQGVDVVDADGKHRRRALDAPGITYHLDWQPLRR